MAAAGAVVCGSWPSRRWRIVRPRMRARTLGYEAAANVAYRPFAASVLCPYDAGRLPEHIVRDALRTHPEILVGEQVRPNAAFVDPRQFLREHMRVEPAPPGACALTLERLEDVAPARGQVAALALASGVASARIDDVKVSVGEIDNQRAPPRLRSSGPVELRARRRVRHPRPRPRPRAGGPARRLRGAGPGGPRRPWRVAGASTLRQRRSRR